MRNLLIMLLCLAPLSFLEAKSLFSGTTPVSSFEIVCEGSGRHNITHHWTLQGGQFEWFTLTGGSRKNLIKAFSVTRAGKALRRDKYGSWEEIIVAQRGGWSSDETGANLFRFQPDGRSRKVRVEMVYAYIDKEGFVTHANSEFTSRERCSLTM